MARVFKHNDWVIKGSAIDIFEFGDLWLNADDLEIIPQHDFPQLNQYVYSNTKMACTIVWALIQSCYLYGLKPTQKDMLDCVVFAHEDDSWMAQYQYGRWWRADLAMRATEKRFEKNYPEKKLYYSTVRRDEPNFWKLLKKWYMLGLIYDWNYQYNKDYQSDCILDWNKFWARTYGHRPNLIYRDWKTFIVDSSAWRSYNEYEVKDLNWLIQNWVFHEVFYVFTKEANIVDKKETARLVRMRNNCKVINFNANKQLSLTNDEMYKNEIREMINVNNKKISEIDEMIKKQDMIVV